MSNFFLESVKDEPLTSLNDRNDLTRMAYQNKSSDIPLRNNSVTDRFEENTFIGSNLPSCPHCPNILRPNVSMFGDFDFYGKPYEFARRKMDMWLKENEEKGKSLVILEIGCGINPHSLRMNNGKMLSGEWKLPKITCLTKMVRLNPDDEPIEDGCIHVRMGAKRGIQLLL